MTKTIHQGAFLSHGARIYYDTIVNLADLEYMAIKARRNKSHTAKDGPLTVHIMRIDDPAEPQETIL